MRTGFEADSASARTTARRDDSIGPAESVFAHQSDLPTPNPAPRRGLTRGPARSWTSDATELLVRHSVAFSNERRVPEPVAGRGSDRRSCPHQTCAFGRSARIASTVRAAPAGDTGYPAGRAGRPKSSTVKMASDARITRPVSCSDTSSPSMPAA